jgi:plasmid maintenance system killer protein
VRIGFRSNQLQQDCNSAKKAARRWGSENARRLGQRLQEMEAAENLAQLFTLPAARCHQLSGDRDEQFAVDLKHPFRLVFEVADDPVPRKDDGGIDRARVTSVEVMEVGDYHGKKHG